MKIPFAKPDITEDEINAVVEAMRAGWVTSGPIMQKFEKEFSQWAGIGLQSIALNSATAGLHLVLEALGVGPGDEVIVPTLTFTATAEVVRYLGATPVFVDVEADSLCINPNGVEKAITDRTKVVIPVHFAGNVADILHLKEVCDPKGIHIVEDAAHAIGSSYCGKRIGSLPTAATVFSFYATKCMTTGEGGMVLTHSKELADRIRLMRLHGIDRDAFNRYSSSVPAWEYDIVAPGYKYNMTDMAAAMGRIQLQREFRMWKVRNTISRRYFEAFRELPVVLHTHCASRVVHAWHLFVMEVEDRDKFIQYLFDKGIGCSVHFKPLHQMTYWKGFVKEGETFPVADAYFQKCVSLPIYSAMTPTQINRVIEVVKGYFK